MIDYKEVRIGNLVSYEGKEYRIAGIYKDYPFLDTIEIGAGVVEWKDLEPIPLTEGWLFKFGFKKSTAWYRNGQHAVNPTIANTYEFKNIVIKEVDYVHELQNLYFALTNKEL